MAFFNRTEVGLKVTSQSVTVPADPKARLMYYLDCMCTVLRLDDNQDINRLRLFDNYYTLTQTDTNVLLSLCLLLKPDVLLNKCIFQNDRLCGDSGNKFYDLETVRNNLLVAGSVMIGGQNKQVNKIMTFKMAWLHYYWTSPMEFLLERQRQEKAEALRRQQRSEELERQRKERAEALRRQQRSEQLERRRQERAEALRRQQRSELLERERQERAEALRRQQNSKACTIL